MCGGSDTGLVHPNYFECMSKQIPTYIHIYILMVLLKLFLQCRLIVTNAMHGHVLSVQDSDLLQKHHFIALNAKNARKTLSNSSSY